MPVGGPLVEPVGRRRQFRRRVIQSSGGRQSPPYEDPVVSGYSNNYLLALACPVLLVAIIAYTIRILYKYKITRS